MVSDLQVRKLMKLLSSGLPLSKAALSVGIDAKTARKYRAAGRPPRADRTPHTWRTRPDPFAAVGDELRAMLAVNPGLQAKTLFAYLQRRYPGQFAPGQLRTLQRQLQAWRALEGPEKEVFFPQEHPPGELAASDFCHLTALGVTLAGQPFDHLLYHFVLTHSNWETGTICFSESFESLSAGLQAALWELGGVPQRHRTDSLSAAVQPLEGRETFTRRYQELLTHYGLAGEHIQPGKAHENGDVEQRHHRFKVALDQALMLRGSRDFADRDDYARFLRVLFAQLNAPRQGRLGAAVGPASTIRVLANTYSVPSRLIGAGVRVKVDVEALEVWYGPRRVERLPRLRGQDQACINYRHVIGWLVKKPGAFAHYRYREALYPTSRFRMAYDALLDQQPKLGVREYLGLLHLAARETEQGVDDALRTLLASEQPPSVAAVKALLLTRSALPPATAVHVEAVDLGRYEALLSAAAA